MREWIRQIQFLNVLSCVFLSHSLSGKEAKQSSIFEEITLVTKPQGWMSSITHWNAVNECIQWYLSIWLKFGAKLESVSLAVVLWCTRNNCCFLTLRYQLDSRRQRRVHDHHRHDVVWKCVSVSSSVWPSQQMSLFFTTILFFNRCG